ncbi:SAM-dependent methyltransferase [Streptomonospora nanhaiensis]|uniref:SAM-dependent methyltransferase n=1 Tax=Streptomonospora nanhaiensis TaxID=1323731 RepID=A0A853BG64_9ACTN|nr:class I SAM-dependent methyltransferase [Streptomonospora nanhaiensis]MBV2366868.1 class I SAM-dependent methyltransferase [Streptomonospora nanhaiensis]NYI94313.1 SAM-dependent methyltransferase [Streptomonospora nanhaiensis]
MHEHTAADDYAASWDARYSESDRLWSGEPNAALVREAADLAPGTALDLGSGEGGDAIWLARRGWRVTGVDISRVALERAAAHVREAGVADSVELRHCDLGAEFPEGRFDLVSAHFLHAHGGLPREDILRRAAAAVAPGGVLLVVGHSRNASMGHLDHEQRMSLPTAEEDLAVLELAEGRWEVLRCEEYEHTYTGADGESTRVDTVVKVRRRAD